MIFYGLFEMQKENKGVKAIGRSYLLKKSLYVMWILICRFFKKVFKGAKSLHL